MNIAVLKERLEKLDRLFSAEAMTEKRVLKALVLDLSEESHFEWTIPESICDSYVSGPALGARLWAEFAGSDVEEESTYESNNPIVITASALSNSGMPGCESVSIAFRSPVTGRLCFNVVSDTVGMRLDALGYAALIILGRLRRPAIVDIRKSGVTYNITELFIGYTVSQVESLVGVGPLTTALSIGPAGEQKVPFAAVVCEGMSTGRGGLGCVFGFKNIKAICITGFNTEFKRNGNEDEIRKTSEKLLQLLDDSEYCRRMRRGGSATLIGRASKNGWAPVFNFGRRTDPRLFHLGGEETARHYGNERGGCIACPVMCRHRTEDGISIPPFESILMLGPNVACFDMDKIIERHALCIDLGLDPVSTGNVMGWASEAWSSGMINLFENDFSFKDNSKVLPLIEMIAKRVGPGEPLSFGTFALGSAYHAESFAYTIRGLECGPYDYRGACGQSISDCMGFWFDNYFEIHSDVKTKDKAAWAVLNENLVMGLESFGVSPSLIVPTIIEPNKKLKRRLTILPKSEINSVKPSEIAGFIYAFTGWDVLPEQILELGERCWRLIYEIDRMLGFDMLEDSEGLLPEHFFIDPDSNHEEPSIVPYRSIVDRYCFLRKQTIVLQGSDLQADYASLPENHQTI